MPEITGGQYYDARDTRGLQAALAEVKAVVAQAPAQAPTPPRSKVIFSDDFEGTSLSRENWEILNENPDRYLIEKGSLMLVNPAGAEFANGKSSNIFRLKQEMPDGDWDIVVDAKFQLQTGADEFVFGLLNDDKNFLGLRFHSDRRRGTGDHCQHHTLAISRSSAGEITGTRHPVSAKGYGCPFQSEEQPVFVKALAENGVRLTISKRDRKYTGTVELRDWSDTKNQSRKVVTQELTSLRVPGRFAMGVGKYDPKSGGETIAYIEKVEIIAHR